VWVLTVENRYFEVEFPLQAWIYADDIVLIATAPSPSDQEAAQNFYKN
jgi:hypothetical protein